MNEPLILPCGYSCCTTCHQTDTSCNFCNTIHSTSLKQSITISAINQIADDDQFDLNLSNALECSICFNTFDQPTTTPCGHTFCRECILRALDYSHMCPICREPVNSCPSITRLLYNITNKIPTEDERNPILDDFDRDDMIPLLVSPLVLPTVSCSIHIFESRYKVMLRRVLASARHRFGVCLVNRTRSPGEPVYRDYGTVLELTHVQTLPDGRSIVEAVGTHRFRVISTQLIDGYHMARIERFDDMDDEQQKRFEQQHILQASVARLKSRQTSMQTPPIRRIANFSNQRRSWAQNAHPQTTFHNNQAPWLQNHIRGVSSVSQKPIQHPTPSPAIVTKNNNELSTDALIDNMVSFIQNLVKQKQSNPNQHWLNALSSLPSLDSSSRDRVKLVWWVSNMMLVTENEKYLLLSMNVLRERVLTVTSWISRLNGMYSNTRVPSTPYTFMPNIPCSTI